MIDAFDRTKGRIWAVGDRAVVRAYRYAQNGVIALDAPIVIDVHQDGAHVWRMVCGPDERKRAIDLVESIQRWIVERTEYVSTEISL